MRVPRTPWRLAALIVFEISCGGEDSSLAASMACLIDTSGYEEERWVSPPAISAPIPPTVPDFNRILGFEFDEGVHASHATAWLEPNEDLALFVSLAAHESEPSAVDSRLVAFVDNVQVHLSSDEEADVFFLFMPSARGRVQTLHARVAADAFSEGAHSLVLALLSAKSGRVLGGRTFTVFKQGYEFTSRPDHLPSVQLVPWNEFVWAPWSGSFSLGAYEPFDGVKQDGGTIPLKMTVQSIDLDDLITDCKTLRIPLTVVALVDGVQIPIGDFGPYLRVVPEYAQAVEVNTELRNLPLDGAPHTLTLLQYQGDGLYSEAPPGKYVPWYDFFTLDLGFAYWQ